MSSYPFSWLRLFICGICMGAADIVPGISGGTIAFVMGFYTDLIASIKSLNIHSISLLIRLKFKEFGQVVAWKFLFVLGSGMAVALMTLSKLIHFLLQHSIYQTYLYSFFLGLVLASTIFCAKQVSKWSLAHFISFFVGVVSAYFLTGNLLQTTPFTLDEGFNGWIICCGAIAISAMLLPGISGSYLLTVFGVYPVIISALNTFISGLKSFVFHYQSFMILLNLMIGIVIGAVLFSRVIAWLFAHYRDFTMTLLIGFMIGAVRSIWPFAQLEEVSSTVLSLSLLSTLIGFGTVFLIEYLASIKSTHNLMSDKSMNPTL